MIEQRDIDRFRRELRTLAAKADDPEGFATAVQLMGELEAALVGQADKLRQPTAHARGYSWADLARPLGVSRQAVAQRWGGKPSVRAAGHVKVVGS